MPIQIDPEGFEIDTLLEYVGSFAGKRVLEVGAGDGRLTWRYAELAAHVTALDPDASEIAIAEKDCPPTLRERVTLLPVGLEDFEPASASPGFDVVLMSWVL